MTYLNGVNNYSDNYKKYSEKLLAESRATLEKSGIEVFPSKSSITDNTDSCVIIKKQSPKDVTQKKETNKNKPKNNESGATWIRDAMPTSRNPVSMSSKVLSSSEKSLANAVDRVTNAVPTANTNKPNDQNEDSGMPQDNYDIFDIEDNATNVDTLSNAGDDEGEGNLLKTYFEKQVKKGFSTNNFAGTKLERDFSDNTSDLDFVLYSDNAYQSKNGKTSFIGGGTASLSYHNNQQKRNIDYNAYAYWKQKASKFTYGLGAMNTKNDDVNNLNISIGAMNNSTGIYAIIQKNICSIPGHPTRTTTSADIGIGRASGFLNPDEYNPKNKNVEEISNIDEQASWIDNKKSNLYNPDEIQPDGSKNPLPNSTINLIILDTDTHKEYGIKYGQMFRHTTKNRNYAFVQPFGKISNINVDSQEGAIFLLGANAGQNITFGSGWNIKTKALVEASHKVLAGSKPSDYILANANISAENRNFMGQFAVGAFVDNTKKYCSYLETKLNYKFNKNFNVYAKAGVAKYKFDNQNDSKLFEAAVGAHYTF